MDRLLSRTANATAIFSRCIGPNLLARWQMDSRHYTTGIKVFVELVLKAPKLSRQHLGDLVKIERPGVTDIDGRVLGAEPS